MLKRQNRHVWGTFFLRHIMSLALFMACLSVQAEDHAVDTITINFSGTLRKPACQIEPEDQSIDINFQTIIVKDLEQGAPTLAKPFVVRLKSCDIQAKEAKVTIKGIGAAGDNNLLALDSASTAKGVGIGFKQGQNMVAELQLNVPSDGQVLSEGDSSLYFGAYVQKLPSATLMEGTFSATATINIEYL